MKRIALRNGLLAVWLLLATQTFAQIDPNAKKILDAVDNKFKKFSTMQANYSLLVTTKASMNAGTNAGTVQIKGNKYAVINQILQIYCDGTTVWRYDPSANEVTVNTATPFDHAFAPFKLFTGFWNKDFFYKLNGSKFVGGKSLTEIEMTPTTKNKFYNKIYLYVDQTQNVVSGAKVVENTGNSSNYSVTNLKTNVSFADSQFVFDKSKHPGVEVLPLPN